MTFATRDVDKEILALRFVETVETHFFKREPISPTKSLRSSEETLHENIEVGYSGRLLGRPV